MIYGSGYLYTGKDDLPEVRLRKLIDLRATKEGIAPSAHVDMVGVKEHLRDLPAGMQASEKQRRKALKERNRLAGGVYLRQRPCAGTAVGSGGGMKRHHGR